MCRFIETIKVIDGKIYNLPLHNERLNNTRREVYNITDKICLEDYIKEIPAEGLWKCRVAYDCSIEEVTFDRYIIRPVKSLKPVYDDNIEYRLKSTDREHLNSLFAQREDCDDIIIIKNGLITDTSIANIALFDGKNWITPKQPLLKGTKRRELLEKGFITEQDIPVEKLNLYQSIRLFNAMIDFGELEFSL